MRQLLLAGLILLALPALGEGRRVIVSLNNAPPYRIVDGHQVSGLYIDILNEIATRLNWDVVYREAPFKRVLWMMKNGQADIMLGPLKTPAREQYMKFVAEAFPSEPRLFFYEHPANRITDYDDLNGKVIGVLRGSSYFPRFDNDQRLNKVTATRYENLMRMLAKDHVDVVVAPEMVGVYTVKQVGVDAYISPFTVPGERSWIAISRQSALMEQAEDIRKAVERLRNSPRYQALIEKYEAELPADEPEGGDVARFDLSSAARPAQ